jgi:hypothetical protein
MRFAAVKPPATLPRRDAVARELSPRRKSPPEVSRPLERAFAPPEPAFDLDQRVRLVGEW